MKNIGVSICTPSIGLTSIAYAMSLGKLANYFSRVPAFEETESQKLGFLTVIGSSIAGARDHMIDQVLAHKETTHVLFIDEDMGFCPTTLNTMLARKEPIVITNYRRRTPPAWFTCKCKGIDEWLEVTEESTGLVEVDFGGFGFALIAKEVIAKIEKPRFLVQWKDGNYGTEDVPFWRACQAEGYSVLCDMDASKKVWHNGNIEYNWFNKYDVTSVGAA